MRLNHFNMLLGTLVTLAAFVTSFLIHGLFIRPGLMSEVRDQQLMEVKALKAGMNFFSQPLSTFSHDYGVWDEMVAFLQSPEPEFIESNLYDDAFVAAGMDGAFLFDTSGKLVWGYQGVPGLLPDSLESQATWIGPVLPDTKAVSAEVASTRRGLIRYGSKVMFFSNSNVLPSNGHGEVIGSFMVVRLIDVSLTDMLKQLTLVESSLSLANPRLHGRLPILEDPIHLDEVAQSHQWLVKDVFGAPALVMTVQHHKSEIPSFISRESMLIFATFMVVVLLGSVPLSLFVLTPLGNINRVLVKMTTRGRLTKINQSFFIDELHRLTGSFNQLAEMLERHQNYLESLSFKDPLTGIANRRGLEAFAARAHQEWLDGKGALGFLMVDVDEFKQYNDTQGHTAGDKALLSVAQTLLIECRRRGELVTRFGGEEFCVVVHGDDTLQMERLAERMLHRVRELAITHPSGQFGYITISVGGVLFEHYDPQFANTSWQDMLVMADKQLYLAKSEGRNRVCVRFMQAARLMKTVG
ncbi:sensor domain-containing diguanylate cyclase [Shewanella zhangzhouensis]|uniref:sensor domain-containing diguanylate cyclase n=1 Tax=Shewanella zhangzhouensis TaxID=2864213 RepID=UPI001C661D58|nr:diguanylate cyclase [Shewanella zhangzhouensis]QYK04266.1 diguanylate cyclase [Shewanella zhangzhouensis]